MDQIAAATGVSKPMLYAYFGSKEGLFAACARSAGARLQESVREAGEAEDLPPDQRLWRGLLAVFTFVEEHREAWNVLYPPQGESPAGAIGAGAAEARDAMAQLLFELLTTTAVAEGVSPAAARETAPLAHALTAATIAVAGWWLRHPEESKELQALRLMNFAWMGFQNLLGGRMWLPPE